MLLIFFLICFLICRSAPHSPRPTATAKALLAEALARMQLAASPRPQPSKRQRRLGQHDRQQQQQQQACADAALAQHHTLQLGSCAHSAQPGLQHPLESNPMPTECHIQQDADQHPSSHPVGTALGSERGHQESWRQPASVMPQLQMQPGTVQKQAQGFGSGMTVKESSMQGPWVKQHSFGGKATWVRAVSQEVTNADDDSQPAPSRACPANHGAELPGPRAFSAAEVGPAQNKPTFEDAEKGKAWDKLTALQQRMQRLIAAMEGQLGFSHCTDAAPGDHPGPVTDAQFPDQCGNAASVYQHRLVADAADGAGTAAVEETSLTGQAVPTDTALMAPQTENRSGHIEIARSSSVLLLALAEEESPQAEDRAVQEQDCGLSDADVQRILAHRRAFIRQQRAHDRACLDGTDTAFDPVQVC